MPLPEITSSEIINYTTRLFERIKQMWLEYVPNFNETCASLGFTPRDPLICRLESLDITLNPDSSGSGSLRVCAGLLGEVTQPPKRWSSYPGNHLSGAIFSFSLLPVCQLSGTMDLFYYVDEHPLVTIQVDKCGCHEGRGRYRKFELEGGTKLDYHTVEISGGDWLLQILCQDKPFFGIESVVGLYEPDDEKKTELG